MQTKSNLRRSREDVAGMSVAKLDLLDDLLKDRIKNRVYSAAAYALAREGKMVRQKAFGYLDKDSATRPTRLDSLFDILSISKPVATASTTMKLVEEGKLDLETKVGDILIPFGADPGRSRIRIRHLLTMSSGLPLDVGEYLERYPDRSSLRSAMLTQPQLKFTPGSRVFYSDLGYRILGMAIEQVASRGLGKLAPDKIFGPASMNDTCYNPNASQKKRCAETGYSQLRKRKVVGEVEDDLDFALGGIVGCDGLFSTASDLTTFVQLLLNDGMLGRNEILDKRSVKLMTTDQVPEIPYPRNIPTTSETLMHMMRAMGLELKLDLDNTYLGTLFSKRAFGKIGGTGSFIAGDPETGLSVVLLTNKGLPTSVGWIQFDKWLEDLQIRQFFDLVNSSFNR